MSLLSTSIPCDRLFTGTATLSLWLNLEIQNSLQHIHENKHHIWQTNANSDNEILIY